MSNHSLPMRLRFAFIVPKVSSSIQSQNCVPKFLLFRVPSFVYSIFKLNAVGAVAAVFVQD